ncbi:MAG: acylphosphatase [Anaerolineae bacterium]|nr:acylphosphatase [Anaerolineae bacterium]
MTEAKSPPLRRLHTVVHGRVQGVNFRAYTLEKAFSLSLKGWVRNTFSGTVEAVAEGDENALKEFLDFLHIGSPSASVTHVDVTWEEATGKFEDFQVRYFLS